VCVWTHAGCINLPAVARANELSVLDTQLHAINISEGRRERQCACTHLYHASGRQSLKLCPWSASLPCMAESSHGRGRSTVLNASLMHSAFLHMKFTIMQVQSRPSCGRSHTRTHRAKQAAPAGEVTAAPTVYMQVELLTTKRVFQVLR
jgi:hypothetical protein